MAKSTMLALTRKEVIRLVTSFMRHTMVMVFVVSSFISSGQSIAKWQISFQAQPELTFHKNDYAYRWREKKTKGTFNVGIGSLVQYNISRTFFVEGGISYVSRRLSTKTFLRQSLLPPPYTDSTLPLYVTKSVALRTLQFPLSLGANIIKSSKLKIFVKGTVVPNFLVNVKYEVNHYPAFKKNYWQGYSANAGAGIDYQLNKKIILTSSVTYSLINTVKVDPYLFSQDERVIAVPHTYLQLGVGMKKNLHRR